MQNLSSPQRIQTVDALRGMALLGILLAHMVYWYNAGPLPGELYGKFNGIGSQVVSILNDILISGKFFAFFSCLFGLSFYLQMNSMAIKSQDFVWRFAWRILVMGMIGLIHHAFWRGDILSIYAPLGLLLLLTRKWSDRWVLIIGILFAFNIPHKLIELVHLLQPVGNAPKVLPSNQYDQDAKAFYAIVKGNSWVNIWVDNLKNVETKFDFQFNSGRIYITFGFFLLGMYLGRLNWLNNINDSLPRFKAMMKKGLWVCLALLLTGLGIILSNEIFKLGWQENRMVGFLFNILYDAFNAVLVIVYITGFSILLNKKSWTTVSGWFAAIGKMALTSYLTQTLFGLLLFFGVGLGLTGKTAPWLNWLIGFAFFSIQVMLSKWWLKHYQYGPIEWFWRSVTYFKWFPMKKQ